MDETALYGGARRRRLSLADASLAALVIGVVGLMVVPLPTWLLDLLLASNLALSVTVLLVTLYVTDALKIAAFPTLLLITTLFRLALNVSSTRLILLQADAGDVIAAFGQFVVRGNYAVGGVIFLILAIIQFVVIAKGSERVAEVGARFVLDAMPGKQMAIDAELRSGSIDGMEAKRRRRTLARESQFYGAMDGAMKFVKGDVIASFLITAINLLGGLAIGVLQRDMAAGAALERYGLLTIGDGLVSQIPALVLATAAGVLVTRVASEEADTPLGQELAAQLVGEPKALRVASVFLGGLALVPGLPALPFMVIAGLLLLASRARARHVTRESERYTGDPVQHDDNAASPRFVPVVVPWALSVSPDLERLLDDDVRGDRVLCPGLRSASTAVRELMFRDLGVPLPACRVSVHADLAPRTIVLSLHELPTTAIAVPDSVADDGIASLVVERCRQELTTRAADFMGLAECQALLDQLEQIAPATVRQVVPKPLGLSTLTEVLRRLLEERVSVRDLRALLEAMATVAATDRDPLNLAEYARSQLRRAISFDLTRGGEKLGVVTLDPQIEDTISEAISRTSAGSFLTLAPAARRDVVAAIARAVESAFGRQSAGPPVVLTKPEIRRFVRKLLETDLPQARVVSYAELLPELHIDALGRATLGQAA